MMNVVDNVRRAFRSKYSFDVQSTWLTPCIAWLRDQFQLPELTNNYALEKIYNQWLHTDISLIADACSLPDDLDLNAKKVQLSGKYALQINSILCISEPYYTQVLDIHGDQNDNERIDTDITETQQWKPPSTKRVLYLQLTDGKTILRGLEYETINGLDRDGTLPGAKILVSGPVLFRRGVLLLTSKNTQVLGGYVDSLLDKNTSIETALVSLSKTASKLDESRVRFNRLNVKVHQQIIDNDSTKVVPDTRTNQNNFTEDEDDVDEFIRQAYADGIFHDDSQIITNPIYTNPPAAAPAPPPLRSLSHNTIPSSTTSTTKKTMAATTTNNNYINNNNNNNNNNSNHNQIPANIEQSEDVILISDDEDSRLSEIKMPPSSSVLLSSTSSSLSYNQTSQFSSFLSPAPPPSVVRPLIPKLSLPYTYLSLIRHQRFSSNVNYQDFNIKGCFSSLTSNPRVVKNEYDLQAYLNDGSDCILVRLASDLVGQRVGITAAELLMKRKEFTSDSDKQKFQIDFNERLKKFGHTMRYLIANMTIRIFSNDEKPMVMSIDES